MKHAKTPWRTSGAANGFQSLIYSEPDQSGKTIAVVYTSQADAEFIVKAVNSYEKLQEEIDKLQCDVGSLHMKYSPEQMKVARQQFQLDDSIDIPKNERKTVPKWMILDWIYAIGGYDALIENMTKDNH